MLPPAREAPRAASSPAVSPRRRFLASLSAPFADGFGGTFHGVLLGIYLLRVGGLSSFAGFAALGTLGGVLAPVIAGVLTSRLGGRAVMRTAAAALVLARIASYAAVLFLDAVWGLFALRLVGAASGVILVTGAKGQVTRGRNASTSLAWFNVSSGAGQAVAAITAGLLSTASDLVIALVATPTVVLATLPTARLARFAPTTTVGLRDQYGSLGRVARTALLGSAVMALVAAPLLLADGLTVERYGVGWLGPLSVMGFVGGFAAASVLPLVERLRLTPRHDPYLWAGLGAIGLSLWAFSDVGPLWLLAGRLVAGIATGVIASRIEARIVGSVPEEQAVPALTASAGVGSVVAAASAMLVGPAIAAIGIRGLTLVCMVLLALVGVATGTAGPLRRRIAHRRVGMLPA